MQSEITPEAMRVQIAQDVIAQVKARRYKATPGEYFETDFRSETPITGDWRDYFEGITANNCRVCALGGVFLSKARLFDNAAIGSVGCCFHTGGGFTLGSESWDMRRNLEEIFGLPQLFLIESAFEVDRIGSNRNTDEDIRKAIDFGCRYGNDELRLIAIMENVIENEGVFKP